MVISIFSLVLICQRAFFTLFWLFLSRGAYFSLISFSSYDLDRMRFYNVLCLFKIRKFVPMSRYQRAFPRIY